MEAKLPHSEPDGVDDVKTLRWALRSDGISGFVFITWHQPHTPLETYEGALFDVTMGDKSTLFPPAPIGIPPGTLAHWPLNLVIDRVELQWATASLLTTLHDGTTTVLVLTAEHGIALTWKWADDVTITSYGDGEGDASTGPGSVTRIQAYRCSTPTTHIDVVVLPASEADRVWVLGDGPERLLVLSEHPVWLETDGRLHGRRPSAEADVHRYYPSQHRFLPVLIEAPDDPPGRQTLPVTLLRPAAEVPAVYGASAGRGGAPGQDVIESCAAVYRIQIPQMRGPGRRELDIGWVGDVAQMTVDGVVIADRFWDGSSWIVDVDSLGVDVGTELTMSVLPMNPGHSVDLPEDAHAALSRWGGGHDAPSVELVSWQQWAEGPDRGL